MFAPQLLPDLEVMELGAAEFVMVSTETVHLDRVDSATYVKAAYTTYLARLHDQLLPDLANPQLVIGSEDLGVEHLACHGGAFYLPRFAVALAQTRVGRLAIVEDAPVLLQPIFSVTHIRERHDPLVVTALRLLREVARAPDQSR